MQSPLDWWEIPLRLGVALLAGMALGFEREVKDKPAGLRTHMLVVVGAAAFMLAGLQVGYDASRDEHYRVDPLRIVQGIIGGIGFLGAGVIAFTGERVTGLTTAASIWLAAAVGIACGAGYYPLAGFTVLFALIVLHAFEVIERKTLDDEDAPE